MTCDGVAGQGSECNHTVKQELEGNTERIYHDLKSGMTMLARYLAAIPKLFGAAALGARVFGGIQSD